MSVGRAAGAEDESAVQAALTHRFRNNAKAVEVGDPAWRAAADKGCWTTVFATSATTCWSGRATVTDLAGLQLLNSSPDSTEWLEVVRLRR